MKTPWFTDTPDGKLLDTDRLDRLETAVARVIAGDAVLDVTPSDVVIRRFYPGDVPAAPPAPPAP